MFARRASKISGDEIELASHPEHAPPSCFNSGTMCSVPRESSTRTNGGNHFPEPGRKRVPSAYLWLSRCLLLDLYNLPPYLPRCLRTWQEASHVMARLFRFYTDTTIRANEPLCRSALPSIWKKIRGLCGAMANALTPASKANTMPRPTPDSETIPLIDEGTGWFSSFLFVSQQPPVITCRPPTIHLYGFHPYLRGCWSGVSTYE